MIPEQAPPCGLQRRGACSMSSGPPRSRRRPRFSEGSAMAKANTIQIKLVSSADTGFFYVTKKNVRNTTGKLEKKKYDPVARKHVVFREAKIK
jgi:large subunit ribosomal protein L33